MSRYRKARPFDIVRTIKMGVQQQKDLQLTLAQQVGPPPWNPMAGNYLSSWADDPAGAAGQYRLMSDDNQISVIGRVTTPATSGTSSLFQLPAGYTVNSLQSWPLSITHATNVFALTTSSPVLIISPSGLLQVANLPVGTTGVEFNALFSTDA